MIHIKNILSGNIARYRKENRLTQEELASKLGLTYQAVSKWETEQSMPEITILPKIAEILKVSVDKLLGYNAYQDDEPYYDKIFGSTDEYLWGLKPTPLCLKLLSLLPPERHLKVLVIGCGEGKDAVFLARCGYDVSAFDISEKGIEKTNHLAENARVHVNTFKADIRDYRLNQSYDILYSVGVLHYIKPELRGEIISNYRDHTDDKGINAFDILVDKPFLAPLLEKETFLWRSGELLTYYHDWFIEDFSEYICDCKLPGFPHEHAMNRMFARKRNGNPAKI